MLVNIFCEIDNFCKFSNKEIKLIEENSRRKMFLNILSLLISSFNINASDANQSWVGSLVNTVTETSKNWSESFIGYFKSNDKEDQNSDTDESEEGNTGLIVRFGSRVKDFIKNQNKSDIAIAGLDAGVAASLLVAYGVNKYHNNLVCNKTVEKLSNRCNYHC